MNKKITWVAFGLLVLLQLWVPASLIFTKENILATGAAFKFRTAPRDPNDYLRGKYVYLQFDKNSFITDSPMQWKAGHQVYLTIGSDSAGFARITAATDKQSDAPKDHIRARISYTDYANPKKIFVEWPFDRLYMEESKAPLAEKAYNESRIDSSIISYALVKVKNGETVLENVYINNQPIVEYIKNKR